MKLRSVLPALVLFVSVLNILAAASAPLSEKGQSGDQMVAAYFRAETAALAERCLVDIRTLEDWKSRRAEYRRQLQEMLGLWPIPERTDLRPVVTGKLEHEEFTVEKLHFQALPKLYVTADLYRPKHLKKPGPAILYLCGHSKQSSDGVSLGNKAEYQHHGAWFARNGYVCLVIDTFQLGEIKGIHHGTYRYGMWWWNARGYTPTGVEAWFGIRALDYLATRPEVDMNRVGLTGCSGGGSYSWTIAALDERIKVVAPVAGITDRQNQVVDGCVEGHCDCMFFVNTYRWDFPLVAALVAPRPLLICDSDKDRIFPLDGVVRLHEKVRRIYRLYGETNKLGLLITEGPHQDTQDLQLPVFRWFNRHLKGEDPVIEMAATKFFAPEQLKVFENIPADQLNTTIHEIFVPKAKAPTAPCTGQERKQQHESWLASLKEQCFAGWPTKPESLTVDLYGHNENLGVRMDAYGFKSQPHVELWLYVLRRARDKRHTSVTLTVLDEGSWKDCLATFDPWLGSGEPGQTNQPNSATGGALGLDVLRREVESGKLALALFAPRGVGPTAWTTNAAKATQIRRRFMLLGQTLDGMRVWDIRRAVQAVRTLKLARGAALELRAGGSMAVNALYASLFEPNLKRMELSEMPKSHAAGPDYLNVLKVLDVPQALELAAERCAVDLR